MTKTALALLLASTAALAGPAVPSDDVLAKDLAAVVGQMGGKSVTISPAAVARVKKHLETMIAKPTLPKTWERKQQAWPAIQRGLAAERLPEIFGYVAWAESGFRADVATPMGSRGVWQFIPATARKYGLTVEGGVDDRLDLEKDSRAAARYLKKLLSDFHDAPLMALAAYNQGEGAVKRIQAAAVQADRDDYFKLAEEGAFNEEGANYVARILAAALVGTQPQRYGLQ